MKFLYASILLFAVYGGFQFADYPVDSFGAHMLRVCLSAAFVCLGCGLVFNGRNGKPVI